MSKQNRYMRRVTPKQKPSPCCHNPSLPTSLTITYKGCSYEASGATIEEFGITYDGSKYPIDLSPKVMMLPMVEVIATSELFKMARWPLPRDPYRSGN